MRSSYLIVWILFCVSVFAQTSTKYSKIKFVYEQKSNFVIQEGKLYADTLLFTVAFPALKISKAISPIDPQKTIGFIALENLNDKQKELLESYLYHSTHTIEGTYDLKKNQTNLYFKRGSKELVDYYKTYFKWSNFHKFNFEKIIRYNKKLIYLNYPRTNYIATIESQIKKIEFMTADKNIGTYSYQSENKNYTNIVTLNKEYSNKIIADVIFSNNEYAVDSIVSLFDTTKLVSVTYE